MTKTSEITFLPLEGKNSPVIRPQARSGNMSEAELVELISSIGSVGLLHPILVREAGGEHIVVTGERRLRAMRLLQEKDPGNPHIQKGVPVIVANEDVDNVTIRNIQIAENLVRSDLSVSETGKALMWTRSSMLIEKLSEKGLDVPREILNLDCPVTIWEQLEDFRIENDAHGVGVPWGELIEHLGIELSPQRAQLLARSIKELPPGVSEDMDAKKVSLHSRIKWLNLARVDPEAAEAVWAEFAEQDETNGEAKLSSVVSKFEGDKSGSLKGSPSADIDDVAETMSSQEDRGDREAAMDWATGRGAVDKNLEEDSLVDEVFSDDTKDEVVNTTARKTIGVLRKMIQEIKSSDAEISEKEKSQIVALTSELYNLLAD